ncbi:MAG: biotin--[acetyl-CoA-carboxylase] ligase [Pseudomonadota bacterium]
MTRNLGLGVTHFATIDSTNAEAKRQWPIDELQLPHWYLADQQTAGTGRRGRSWASPSGNFSGTVLMVPSGPASEWYKYTYVISLALYDALLELGVSEDALSLKWPNDVLLMGQKIAGILLETVGQNQPEAMVIGIGVNLAYAPDPNILDEKALSATSLKDALGVDVTLERLFVPLQSAFTARTDQYITHGWPATTADWQARCSMIGRAVTYSKGTNATYTGTATGLAEDGALLVRTAGGIERVLAGDVKVREV